MNIVEENWDEILNKMKVEYCSSNISYNTWIAPLTVYEVDETTVYILVRLKASLEHIEEKYLLPFKVCIAEITGRSDRRPPEKTGYRPEKESECII